MYRKIHQHHVFKSHLYHNYPIPIMQYSATMTRLILVMVPTLNQTHNSTLYACGTDITLGSSYELDLNLCELQAFTLSSNPLLKGYDKSLVTALTSEHAFFTTTTYMMYGI